MTEDRGWHEHILQELPIGVYAVDPQRRITFWNHGAEHITGFRAGEMVGTACPDALLEHIDHTGTNLCQNGCPLSLALSSGKPQDQDIFLHHKAGHRVPVHVRVQPIFDDAGSCVGAVEVFQDNTPQMTALARINELQEQAYIDPLTGLANRRYAEQQLEYTLTEMKRLEWSFGVISMDIDHFKRINDRYGHAVGDETLTMVAGALRSGTRGFDVLARWGGEEFLCLAINIHADQLVVIAERLRLLVEQSFLTHNGERIAVTLSAGAALHKPGESARELLQRADQLLYESKAAGKNRVTHAA